MTTNAPKTVLSAETQNKLARKPCQARELGLVELSEAEERDIPVRVPGFAGGLFEILHAAAAEAQREGISDFVITVESKMYVVSTEGYDYARYIGVVGRNQALSLAAGRR